MDTALYLLAVALDLLIGSAVDWPLMLYGGEVFPHWPGLDFIRDNTSDGSIYHEAKGFWSELVRADGEYWSKFTRFAIWWALVPRFVFKRWRRA